MPKFPNVKILKLFNFEIYLKLEIGNFDIICLCPKKLYIPRLRAKN